MRSCNRNQTNTCYSYCVIKYVLFTQHNRYGEAADAAVEAARNLAESTESLQARLSDMLMRLRKSEKGGQGAAQERHGGKLLSEPSLHPLSSGASDPKC